MLSVLPRVWKVGYNDEEVGKLAVSVLLLIFFGFFPYVIIRTEKNSLKNFSKFALFRVCFWVHRYYGELVLSFHYVGPRDKILQPGAMEVPLPTEPISPTQNRVILKRS